MTDRAIAVLKWWIDAAENSNQHGENMVVAAVSAPDLLSACKAAKKYLEPNLTEPGRTVFWMLVDAIAKAEGR